MNSTLDQPVHKTDFSTESKLAKSDELRFSPEVIKNNLLHHLAQNSAAIAHEVRNPLQTLQALLNTLESSNSIDQKYVSVIREELTRADQLLSDFLNLFKECKHEFAAYDLNTICSKIVMLMRSSAMMKGIDLEENYASDLPPCLCEESRIKQILINLLSNAFDASQRGQSVIISTYMNELYICLSVKDHGSGIPEDIIESIFEPFFTRKAAGTGMGLFLCRQIAKDHGGSLQVKSQPGQGSEFILSLPI
ncbi:MAG: two-component system sensor histidine kinase NtrB [Bacillota bacterium]